MTRANVNQVESGESAALSEYGLSGVAAVRPTQTTDEEQLGVAPQIPLSAFDTTGGY